MATTRWELRCCVLGYIVEPLVVYTRSHIDGQETDLGFLANNEIHTLVHPKFTYTPSADTFSKQNVSRPLQLQAGIDPLHVIFWQSLDRGYRHRRPRRIWRFGQEKDLPRHFRLVAAGVLAQGCPYRGVRPHQ